MRSAKAARKLAAALAASLLVLLGTGSTAPRVEASPLYWEKVGEFPGSTTLVVRSFAVYQNQLYAGIGPGVKRYNGTTWEDLTSFPGTGTEIALDMEVFNGSLYVGTNTIDSTAKVWQYDGSTWNQVNTSGFGEGSTVYEVRALAVYNNELYATASVNGQKFRVYKYSGSGTSWINISGPWDNQNKAGLSAISYNNYLWVGTENTETGTEV